jgi:hypothetical protein
VTRYLVERAFPEGFPIASNRHGRADCARILASNAELGVTWLHSYIAEDERKTFCLCEAPSPEALRRAAGRSRWPVDVITRVTVLDPHFHLGPHTSQRRRMQ